MPAYAGHLHMAETIEKQVESNKPRCKKGHMTRKKQKKKMITEVQDKI